MTQTIPFYQSFVDTNLYKGKMPLLFGTIQVLILVK